ncbi:MAG TPA: hypothetical protein VF163_02030 [Micromonosporaceae bacterium]
MSDYQRPMPPGGVPAATPPPYDSNPTEVPVATGVAPVPAATTGAQGQAGGTQGRDTTEIARGAAKDVAHSVKEDARSVAQEVNSQAQHVLNEVKGKAREQADNQQRQWAETLHGVSNDLHKMVQGQPETPARSLVVQVAERSSDLADYLGHHSVSDVINEVEAYARRRPGRFLLAAAATGFVVGRLGKGVREAQSNGGDGRDYQSSGRDYPQRTYVERGYGQSGYAQQGMTERDYVERGYAEAANPLARPEYREVEDRT